MQNYIRSIIIIVDNRAQDMKETYNLVAIERGKIDELGDLINSTFSTEIKLNEEEIKRWKEQFNKEK